MLVHTCQQKKWLDSRFLSFLQIKTWRTFGEKLLPFQNSIWPTLPPDSKCFWLCKYNFQSFWEHQGNHHENRSVWVNRKHITTRKSWRKQPRKSSLWDKKSRKQTSRTENSNFVFDFDHAGPLSKEKKKTNSQGKNSQTKSRKDGGDCWSENGRRWFDESDVSKSSFANTFESRNSKFLWL